jgi:hypothetical protein
MKNKELMEKLNAYGYSLLMPDDREETANVLNEISASREQRILEGFPVVLLNMIKKEKFSCQDYNKLNKLSKELFIVSLICFEMNSEKTLSQKFKNECNINSLKMKVYGDLMKKRRNLKVGGETISSERVLNTFQKYNSESEKNEGFKKIELKENLNFNKSLNRLFPPKQKEIIFKRLDGDVLTQTEKEYYSRVVKKRIEAILNEDLQRFLKQL